MINAMDQKLKNVQFFTGNQLKLIACLCMLIDHVSKIPMSKYMDKLFSLSLEGMISEEQFFALQDFQRQVLFGIGTIAFPLFCFLLAEGFRYTRNRKRYIGSMLVFAIISEIPFDIGFFHAYSMEAGTFPFYFAYQNVFFTLFLGLVCLTGLEAVSQRNRNLDRKEKAKGFLLQIGIIAIVSCAAELLKCDYGAQGIIFIAGFYIFRKSHVLQVVMFLVLYMATTGNQPPTYTMIAAFLLLLYNGKRGKWKAKYLFYWFYPIHIFVLYVIAQLFL